MDTVNFLNSIFGSRGTPIALLFATLLIVLYGVIVPVLWSEWRKKQTFVHWKDAANPDLIPSAIWALGEIRQPLAMDTLRRILSNENNDINWRREAAIALGKIGDSRAVEPLLAAVQNSASVEPVDDSVKRSEADEFSRVVKRRPVDILFPDDSVKRSEVEESISDELVKKLAEHERELVEKLSDQERDQLVKSMLKLGQVQHVDLGKSRGETGNNPEIYVLGPAVTGRTFLIELDRKNHDQIVNWIAAFDEVVDSELALRIYRAIAQNEIANPELRNATKHFLNAIEGRVK